MNKSGCVTTPTRPIKSFCNPIPIVFSRPTKIRPMTATAFSPYRRSRSKLTPAGCPETILQMQATKTTPWAWRTWTEKSPRPQRNPPTSLRWVTPPTPALEEQLRAVEPENWTPPAKQLADENIPLLPPGEITDETLTPILWELLHNLALRGFYVLHTDHLSDRELYAELWTRGLREPAHLPGRNPRGGWFHDFLGRWREEGRQLWLRYYGSDEERAQHAKEWPKTPLHTKEQPAFNRDWRLPKGPF